MEGERLRGAIDLGRSRAERRWGAPVSLARDPWGTPHPVAEGSGNRCLAPVGSDGGLAACGERCRRLAGRGTDHPGAGRCRAHGGDTRAGRAEGAWLTMIALAGELDLSPWDALLLCVRRTAAAEQWLAQRLDEQARVSGADQILAPESDFARWYGLHAGALDRLARFAKMAVDAGVAERLTQVEEVRAAQVVGLLNAALAAGALSADQEAAARGELRRQLLALEGRPA